MDILANSLIKTLFKSDDNLLDYYFSSHDS